MPNPLDQDAVTFLRSRGAPLTAYNLNSAMDFLGSNPQVRLQLGGGERSLDNGQIIERSLPALDRGFVDNTPTSADEAAVSAQINGGQSLVTPGTANGYATVPPVMPQSKPAVPQPPVMPQSKPSVPVDGDVDGDVDNGTSRDIDSDSTSVSASGANPYATAASNTLLDVMLGMAALKFKNPKLFEDIVSRISGNTARTAVQNDVLHGMPMGADIPTQLHERVGPQANAHVNNLVDDIDASVNPRFSNMSNKTIPLVDKAPGDSGLPPIATQNKVAGTKKQSLIPDLPPNPEPKRMKARSKAKKTTEQNSGGQPQTRPVSNYANMPDADEPFTGKYIQYPNSDPIPIPPGMTNAEAWAYAGQVMVRRRYFGQVSDNPNSKMSLDRRIRQNRGE